MNSPLKEQLFNKTFIHPTVNQDSDTVTIDLKFYAELVELRRQIGEFQSLKKAVEYLGMNAHLKKDEVILDEMENIQTEYRIFHFDEELKNLLPKEEENHVEI